MNEQKIADILNVFEADVSHRPYPAEAIDQAIALQAEITPHLIQLLQKVTADPDRYYQIDYYYGHLYALMLLGHFKEATAHQTIIDFVSLPEETIDGFLGDIITEDLRMVLFKTCGGSVDRLKQLILHRAAHIYCRGAAMDALVYAVVTGLYPRSEAADFLAGLFSGDEAETGSVFWACVSQVIQELHLISLMPLLEQAHADDMIDLFFWGDWEGYKSEWVETQEAADEKMRQEMARYSLDDLHKTMSWWAMFEQPEVPKPKPKRQSAWRGLTKFLSPRKKTGDLSPPEHKTPVQPPKPQRQKKKKKRKIAKAARKKNRGR